MDVGNVDQTNHFGLLGMRERVQGLHGPFNIDASTEGDQHGTTIKISIPKEANH